MKQSILKRLKEIVGIEKVLDSQESLLAYSYDATAMKPQLPACVIRPDNVEQVSQIVKLANDENFPIVPRGSGTCLCGGAIPMENSVVLLTNHWNRILEIDMENLTAHVEAGVITAELHKAVEMCGYFYPPDPGSSSISTIGGNVAENAGGLRGLKYGVTKNYVLGLEVVLPNGEILKTGGKTIKDVAGYNLKDLFIGSEGTLGIFTKILLRLLPKPETSRTFLVYYSSMEKAAKTVTEIISSKVSPAVLEFMDNTTIKCIEDYAHLGLPTSSEAILLIELDGRKEIINEDTNLLKKICSKYEAIVNIAEDEQEAIKLKTARKAAFPSLARATPTLIMEDVAVPRSKVAELVLRIQEISKKYNITIGNFGHIGDGNLHPNYLTDEKDKDTFMRAEKAIIEVEKTAIELGGSITGEHGIGLYKKHLLETMVGSPSIKVMNALKLILDPNNIMNRGKVLDLKPKCEGILACSKEQIKKFEDVD